MTVTAKTFPTAWDAIPDTLEEVAILKASADLMVSVPVLLTLCR